MARRQLAKSLLAVLTVVAADPALTQQRPAASAVFTLDTPIEKLLRNTRAKAVLSAHLPALVSDSHLWMYDHKNLKEVAAYPGSSVSRAKLQSIAAELAKIR